MCSVIIAQDNCNPEILFKTWCCYFEIVAPNPPPVGWVGGGTNQNIYFLDSWWNVWHMKFLPIKLPTPGGVGWGKLFVITFLGSSWHFPDFLFFEPLKFPLRPPLVGGGVKKCFIDFLDSSWNLPDFWNFDPQPPPPPNPPPRGGMGKKMFIDFLGSSWHFPDFWFFDSLKFPLRPPVVGGG